MTGIGTGPEETGDRVQDAWTDAFADPNADTLDALVAAVEARTRELVAAEAGVLRVRSDASRQVHEAVRTRFGLLLPACGIQYGRPGPPVADGAAVTCHFCNGDEQPMNREQR